MNRRKNQLRSLGSSERILMPFGRQVLVAMVISSIFAGCCQTAPMEPRMVCDSAGITQPTEFSADRSGVFALVHWGANHGALQAVDAGKPSTQSITSSVELNTQIQVVCVDSWNRMGFRRENNQLIGFAGTFMIPLEEGHYSWDLLSSDDSTSNVNVAPEHQQGAFSEILTGVWYLTGEFVVSWFEQGGKL
jgi:hypothetical protein